MSRTPKSDGERLAELVSPRSPDLWIPHSPFSPHLNIPQAAFLALKGQEALYGGAAGGGKTDALLMAALQYADVPGYSALLLRRTFPQLSQAGGLIPRAAEWLLNSGARGGRLVDGMPSQWTFSNGAKISFGHMQYERDRYSYQGGEYQFVGFDELTQFTREQYLYLLSRLRRLEGSNVPIRARSASNPGGEGHQWVRERFIPDWYVEGEPGGDPKWSEPDDHGRAEPIVFIPAKLEDNPYLDREEYARTLAKLDPVTRLQLRHGDWSAVPRGPLFRRETFEIVASAPRSSDRARYWDLAATAPAPGKDPDWTRGVKGFVRDGVLWIEDIASVRSKPSDVEALIRQCAELDGPGVAVWIEQEPGASGVNTIDHYQRRVLPGYAVYGHRVTGPQLERVRPLSAAADVGNVRLVHGPWIKDFLDELEAYPAKGVHDDQVTATAGLLEVHTQLRVLAPDEFYGVAPAEGSA